MARTVIITSYLEYPLDVAALLRPDDVIVCLDGGFDIAQRLAITPDVLLGDFDSIKGPLPESGIEIRRYPPEKDYTDLEIALRTLDPEQTPNLLIIGGLGGRLDQTMVNIQMLQRYTSGPASGAQPGEPSDGEDREHDVGSSAECSGSSEDLYGSFRQYRSIQLMDGRSSCFVVHGGTGDPASPGKGTDSPDSLRESRDIIIPRREGYFLSLLPLSETCCGIDLENVKYPLSDATLHKGASLSISNEFLPGDQPARLRLRSGSLLVIVTRD